jgi:hypothetical protein
MDYACFLIEMIEYFIEETYSYKDDRNNPSISECPEIIDFEHWQSFSIVTQEVDYFGDGSKEEWPNAFEKLSLFYYNEF